MNREVEVVPRETAVAKIADSGVMVAAETAKAHVQAAYLMAMQHPRNRDQARLNILHACRRPEFAETAEFSKPTAEGKIVGFSIRFAEAAIQEWGNIFVDTRTIIDDERVIRKCVLVRDLETNASFSTEVSIYKTVERKSPRDREIVGRRTNSAGQVVFIVKATDEEMLNKEFSVVSRVIRNNGLRLLPPDILHEARDLCRATLRDKDAKDPQASRKKIIDSFAEIGVKPENLETLLGHPLDAITPADLGHLRKVYRALSEGEATWKDYFGKGEDVEPTPPKTGRQKVTRQPAAAPPSLPEQEQKPEPEPDEALVSRHPTEYRLESGEPDLT